MRSNTLITHWLDYARKPSFLGVFVSEHGDWGSSTPVFYAIIPIFEQPLSQFENLATCHPAGYYDSTVLRSFNTRNFLTFVNTTAIAYHQNHETLTDCLPICNRSRVYKRQKITSTRVLVQISGVPQAQNFSTDPNCLPSTHPTLPTFFPHTLWLYPSTFILHNIHIR